jgi:SAM-dependent methyltransferase
MTEGAQKRLGFSAIGGRKAKAEKIVAILAAAGRPLKADDDVLDLGCGSGEVAAYLARRARVTCADAVDQRTAATDLPFHCAGARLVCADASFDVVVSNHVIEHTADPIAHLAEIRRLLRPGGVAYLATPNRWWPWEVHARLPLLHYLPWRLFSRIANTLGRLHEPVRLISLAELRRLCAGSFELAVWHHRLLRDAQRFHLVLPTAVQRLLGLLPEPVLRSTAALQPTLIVLLIAR